MIERCWKLNSPGSKLYTTNPAPPPRPRARRRGGGLINPERGKRRQKRRGESGGERRGKGAGGEGREGTTARSRSVPGQELPLETGRARNARRLPKSCSRARLSSSSCEETAPPSTPSQHVPRKSRSWVGAGPPLGNTVAAFRPGAGCAARRRTEGGEVERGGRRRERETREGGRTGTPQRAYWGQSGGGHTRRCRAPPSATPSSLHVSRPA